MWSLGVTFYYILIGDLPFEKQMDAVKKEPSYPSDLTDECIYFLKRLLEKDKDLRFSCEDALEDKFLSD